LDTFSKSPKYSLVLSRPEDLPEGYPCELVTIGNHIRKKRLDSGLFQRQAAEIIGVCEQTLFYWEHGREPELRHMPAVIKFLGYVPFECPNDPLGKLRYFKRVNGLNYKKLAEMMGKHPEQLTDWLSG
jgi:DNA-binding XRE family transcriptional regulator